MCVRFFFNAHWRPSLHQWGNRCSHCWLGYSVISCLAGRYCALHKSAANSYQLHKHHFTTHTDTTTAWLYYMWNLLKISYAKNQSKLRYCFIAAPHTPMEILQVIYEFNSSKFPKNVTWYILHVTFCIKKKYFALVWKDGNQTRFERSFVGDDACHTSHKNIYLQLPV